MLDLTSIAFCPHDKMQVSHLILNLTAFHIPVVKACLLSCKCMYKSALHCVKVLALNLTNNNNRRQWNTWMVANGGRNYGNNNCNGLTPN